MANTESQGKMLKDTSMLKLVKGNRRTVSKLENGKQISNFRFLNQFLFSNNRFSKFIVWLILATFVVNLGFWSIPPKKARAADPNMYLFWVGTCNDASMPAGWTLVSDGGAEEFNNMFPRGNTAYSARAKTTDTHTHTGTGASTASAAGGKPSGAGATYASTSHTHAVTVNTVSNVSSLPAYKNMCVIKYSGIPTIIPLNAVAIFDTTFGGSWPTNWEDYSSTYRNGSDRFIRGGADTTTTGGSNSHTGAGHAVTATLDTVTGTVAGTTGTKTAGSPVSHTHTQPASFNSDAPADTQPQYITVVVGRATANTTIPAHMIAMFDGSSFSSFGWETVSDNGDDFYLRFPKVTGTYGTKSGADTHHHAQMSGTSTTYTPATNLASGSGSAQIAHSHPMTVDLADGTNTNIPPYTDVIFAKKSYDLTVATDSGSYPTLPLTIKVTGTAYNYSNTDLALTKIDYVIFRDTVTPDNQPTAGETYMYKTATDCDTSGVWGTDGPGYTFQTTGFAVGTNSTVVDETEGPGVSHSCTNSAFPDNATYTLWGKWYANGGTPIYDTNYVTFTSIPTLGQVFFVIFVIIVLVFVGRLILHFKRKRYWLFYYLGATFTTTIVLILMLRRFGIDQYLVNAASYHVYLLANRLLHLPLDLLSNGRFQLLSPDGGSSILKLGIECSAVIESSILFSLLIFYPIFSLRQRLLRITLGLTLTYVINIIRLMIIVSIAYKFGSDYIFIAHALVGRVFFFLFEILLYWWVFTKPVVKSVGDSITKKIPLQVTARSGHSLQWRYTFAQATIVLLLISILGTSFVISNDWQKAFIGQKPAEKQVMGEEITPIKINNLSPGQSQTQLFHADHNSLVNLKIIEAKERMKIEIRINDRFVNRNFQSADYPIFEQMTFENPINIKKGDIFEIIITNLGTNKASFNLGLIRD